MLVCGSLYLIRWVRPRLQEALEWRAPPCFEERSHDREHSAVPSASQNVRSAGPVAPPPPASLCAARCSRERKERAAARIRRLAGLPRGRLVAPVRLHEVEFLRGPILRPPSRRMWRRTASCEESAQRPRRLPALRGLRGPPALRRSGRGGTAHGRYDHSGSRGQSKHRAISGPSGSRGVRWGLRATVSASAWIGPCIAAGLPRTARSGRSAAFHRTTSGGSVGSLFRYRGRDPKAAGGVRGP